MTRQLSGLPPDKDCVGTTDAPVRVRIVVFHSASLNSPSLKEIDYAPPGLA